MSNTRIVPHAADYNLVKSVDSVNAIVLYTSAAITLASIIIDRSKFELQGWDLPLISGNILGILSITYLIVDIIQGYLFHAAEVVRKNDFIDNSLGSGLPEVSSKVYFSNDNIPQSVLKLGVNCFENSFFTKKILRNMLKPMILTSAVILLLYLALAVFIDSKTFTTLLQVALPITVVVKLVKSAVLYYNARSVFNHFTRIFTSASASKMEPLIIDNVLLYEKNLSWAGVLLDSKLFSSMNEDLSVEWEKLKAKYNISTQETI